MKRIALFVIALFVSSFAVNAQVFDFTLENQTGFIIDEVYVSPSDDDEWGEDVLGLDTLNNKQSVPIEFDPDYEEIMLAFGVDLYDLKVIDEDGDEFIYNDLKLETISKITLTLKNGKGVAILK